VDEATRTSHAGAFEHAADDYARSRPSYPSEAVDWLVGRDPADICDLGAGTGALTGVLTARGHRVVAAEPSAAMLGQLTAAAPSAVPVRAQAERLPFGDGSFDVVTVAQAFHWFDHGRALPEIARVLRDAGTLSIVYNGRDDRVPWVAALTELFVAVQPGDLTGDWGVGSVDALDGTALFAPRSYAEFGFVYRLDRDALVRLSASRSYIINLDRDRRAEVLEQVGHLFDSYAEGHRELELPYVTQCWRAERA
jgi:SAM-dependent methyltransferase